MNILLTENQFKILTETSVKHQNLCKTFGKYSEFCSKVEKILKDSKTGGVEGNLINLSRIFFNDVVKNPKYFKTITLAPGNPEFDNRLESLNKLNKILNKYNSCPNIQEKVINDIEILPTKGLQMTVDENNQYSLLNRLETHYSAKSYLLSKIILDNSGQYKEKLNNYSDEEVRSLIKNIITNKKYIDEISEYLSDLLDENQEFYNYFMGSIEYSRNKGNKVEQDIFNVLKKKYGEENVIEFSEDFGFVDYFGIDGVIIRDGFAQPIQISSSVKYNPEIFTYSSDSCKPLGFFKSGNKIIKYQPI